TIPNSSSSSCWSRGSTLLRTKLKNLDFDNETHDPDDCLITFYRVGLNTSTQAQLSGDCPQEGLTTFIEWVLVGRRHQPHSGPRAQPT
ncbi:hypothetical protein M9458_044234, partial [Cirrhinus mrigala]